MYFTKTLNSALSHTGTQLWSFSHPRDWKNLYRLVIESYQVRLCKFVAMKMLYKYSKTEEILNSISP